MSSLEGVAPEDAGGEQRLLVYELPREALGAGSSLGNDTAWVTSKATGAVESLFSLDLDRVVAGSLVIRYSTSQHGLMQHGCPLVEEQGKPVPLCRPEARVQLEESRPGIFRIHPAYQQRSFELPGGLAVTETLFVPSTPRADPSVVFQALTLRNKAPDPRSIRILAYASLRGGTPADMVGAFDEKLGALLSWNESEPDWVRVLGFSERATGHMTTHDVSRAYDPVNVLPLTSDTTARGSILGVVQADVELAVGETRELAVILAFSPRGQEEARRVFKDARDFRRAFQETVDHYRDVLAISRLETPDPVINQGVQWCKANMLRVMGDYPFARGFTNNPGVSSHVVIRDLAWFVYGNDWLEPAFSREMLRAAAGVRYPSGKLPEYFDALDGRVEDYGLNINDATPLFILAVCHHCCFAASDPSFLEDLFPAVEDAARYLLSQRDERGLVYCTAQGQNVWGIASWRNVIPDYTINGAVTEINALCYAALKIAARLAADLRRTEVSRELDGEAETLKEAINRHLLNPDNGMYYLNIDTEGNRHTDVTSDEVFPVMFQVASEDVAFRIISRLNSRDFWTEAGLRVVSDQSPDYQPSTHVGLLGGVWPGVVFWYAFAAARYHPEFMVRGLHEGYESYLADPRKNNTVPGQFSEWFDGESLVNRGMRLSPWEPPRYLWAAIEGLAGVTLGSEGLSLDPRLPPDWKWLSLRRLPHRGREISFFAVRAAEGLRLYCTEHISSPHATIVCGRDVTAQIESWSDEATTNAFADGKTIHVCMGSSADQTVIVPWSLHGLLEPDRCYRVRTFSSEYPDWVDGGESLGRDLMGLAAPIEPYGFYMLRFEPVEQAPPEQAGQGNDGQRGK